MSKASSKGPPPRRRQAGRNPAASTIQWNEAELFVMPAANADRRFFKLETLTNAMESEIEQGSAFFQSIVMQALQSRALVRMHGALVFENDAHLEWRLSFMAHNRRRKFVRLVVAKNDREFGEIVKSQFANLRLLDERIPKNIPRPLKLGRIFLPDRHGRKGFDRQIPAFVTDPLPKTGPCTITKTGQFRSTLPSPKLLAQRESDALKRRIIELCLRSHDAGVRNAMPPPDLSKGALRIALQKKGRPEAYIAECRGLWTSVTHVDVLHRLTGFDWTADGVPVPLLPKDTVLVVQALVNALGKQKALGWLKDYEKALETGRYAPHHRLPLADVAGMAGSLES